MATFAISLSVSVEAENLEEALEIQGKLYDAIRTGVEVNDIYEIDVEQQDEVED